MSASTQLAHGAMVLAANEEKIKPIASEGVLLAAIGISIAAIILLITVVKLHPFISLTLGSALLAIIAGVQFEDVFDSYTSGVGKTLGSVGVLIAFGAIIGQFLVSSGGAMSIVDRALERTPSRWLPVVIAVVAFIIAIPLFFEVGVVLLVPIIVIAAHRTQKPVMLIAVPALAALSALHGFVPPHPGPLLAIESLKADLGLTLGIGLLVAIPVVAVAGPLLAPLVVRMVPNMASDTGHPAVSGSPEAATGSSDATAEGESKSGPSIWTALSVILLPVVLMIGKTVAESALNEGNSLRQVLNFIGEPLVALLAATLVALLVLSRHTPGGRPAMGSNIDKALAGVASIILIVGAGGGFKETIVQTGVASVIGDWAKDSGLSVLLLGWLIAVGVRLATGSATVATITTASIMVPLATDLSNTHLSLLVLAIGAGSVFLSHVNDAGFWLIKEYFNLTIAQTFKSWSLLECVVSVTGLVVVMLLSLVI